jgi:hypothetical protein
MWLRRQLAMTIHVGEATSEVVVEPEAEGAGQAERLTWEDEERQRALRDRLRRNALRTQADDFSD